MIENMVKLAVDGHISPGKAITLGCGVGRETIYLAKNGFDVIGLDFSSTAIERARRRARAEGVGVSYVIDDLTNLQHVNGTFDLISDFGALNDMSQEARDLYMRNVLPLARPGSHYLMMCFDKKVPIEEVERRFGDYFAIELLDKRREVGLPRQLALYLMERNSVN
ncbi:MAG: methyltransferase domain-containing protein [Anaerolineales bacterium]|jgi:cyclopropane fatty-acyl-phospholipid synthase-like methyltransferase